MTPSPLSNALVSYLASRSQDWTAWQVEEDKQKLKVSILYQAPTAAARTKLFIYTTPITQSVAELILEIFSKIEAGSGQEADSLPEAELGSVRNSLGVGVEK